MRLESASSASVNMSRDSGSASAQSSAVAKLTSERTSETSIAVPSKQGVQSPDSASGGGSLHRQSGSGEYIYHGLTSASALDETSWSHTPSRDVSHDPQISMEWIQKQLEAEALQQRESSHNNGMLGRIRVLPMNRSTRGFQLLLQYLGL